MTVYRCLMDWAGYCKNPDRQGIVTADCSDIGHPGVHILQTPSSFKCPSNPPECGFFITWKEDSKRYAIAIPLPDES